MNINTRKNQNKRKTQNKKVDKKKGLNKKGLNKKGLNQKGGKQKTVKARILNYKPHTSSNPSTIVQVYKESPDRWEDVMRYFSQDTEEFIAQTKYGFPKQPYHEEILSVKTKA